MTNSHCSCCSLCETFSEFLEQIQSVLMHCRIGIYVKKVRFLQQQCCTTPSIAQLEDRLIIYLCKVDLYSLTRSFLCLLTYLATILLKSVGMKIHISVGKYVSALCDVIKTNH